LDLLLDIARHVGAVYFADDACRPSADLLGGLGVEKADFGFLLRPIADSLAFAQPHSRFVALARRAARALSQPAIHLVASLVQLCHGVVQHLHLLELLLEVAHVVLELIEEVAGVLKLVSVQAFGALSQLAGHLL
jgi:hypothetical protein